MSLNESLALMLKLGLERTGTPDPDCIYVYPIGDDLTDVIVDGHIDLVKLADWVLLSFNNSGWFK